MPGQNLPRAHRPVQLHANDVLPSYKPTLAQLLQKKTKKRGSAQRLHAVQVLTLIPPFST